MCYFFFYNIKSIYVLFFFFSSRRRHTRFKCDWSSDVCSSDLLCGFSAAATVASFTAETTNPTNKFATGTLVLSNKVNSGTACLSTGGGSTDTNANAACDNLFSLTAQKPGDTSSANLTLQNVGSIAASALKLFTSACTDSD